MTGGEPLWTKQVGRRPLLAAAGAIAGAAALPGGRAQAAVRGTTVVAASADDVVARGFWLAGDTHVHCDHSSDGSFIRQVVSQQGPGNLSVADQIGEGERIGLQWMPLTDHRTYDQHWDPQWTSSKLLLIPGEEANGSPHATCLGAVDVVVDGANPPGSPSHRHVQQSIWESQAQDASWGIAHPDDTRIENDSVVGASTIETWNRASLPDVEIDYAESRWNKGFRYGVAGACDCHFKELWPIAGPGMPTTWVLSGALSERAILDALRGGRTTLSSSPVGAFVTLEADADGDGVFEAVGGDEVAVPVGRSITLRVRAQRAPGMQLLVYEAPGRAATPLLDVTVTGIDETHTLTVNTPSGTHWWRAEIRGYGTPPGLTTDPQADIPKQPDQLQAMTSPLFATSGALAVPQPTIALPPLVGDASGAVVVSGDWNGFPDVAVAATGPQVVSELHRAGLTYVEHHGPTGTRKVFGNGKSRFPKVVAAGNDVWLTYQEEHNQLPHTPQIYLAHSADGGRTWGSERLLSDGQGRQERPAIGLLPDGRPVVAWQAATGSAVEILVWAPGDTAPTVLSNTGKVITPPNPADTRSARYPASLFPDIAVLADAVVVSWQDNRNDPDPGWTGHLTPPGTTAVAGTDPDAWEPMVSVRRLDATTWSAPIRVAPAANRADCHPALGATPDGTLVCAWDSRPLSSSGVSPAIQAATSTDLGLTWSTPVAVDPAPSYFSQRPRLAADPDGRLRMVWYDARGTDWRWAVRSAVLAESGWQPEGEVLRGGNCTWPALNAGVVVAATDRNAQSQRDRTQDIVLASVAGAPATDVPEIPLPVVLPVLAAGLTAVLARARRRTGADHPA
ncbi:MAG: hypothetical protein JWP11_2715 [Frankiales bacterium]|nr:hypothetical protein [Frankiales bacterium]